MSHITRLGQLRSPVSTYANLTLTGNVIGDVRVVTDTGDAYTWLLVSPTGSLSDWKKITTSNFSDLVGAPSVSTLAIDDAVKTIKSLTINTALIAFEFISKFSWKSLRMFDGFVDKFGVPSEDNEFATAVDQTTSTGFVFLNGAQTISSFANYIDHSYWYAPYRGDLDANTLVLIHGNGVNGSTGIIDLLRNTITNTNATVNTTTKKFGTGSISFNGTNASLALSDVDALTFGSDNFTIECWINLNNNSTTMAIAEQYVNANNKLVFYYHSTGKVGFEVIDAGNTLASYLTTASLSLATGTWYHLALVRNGSTISIFKDGVSQTVTENTAISTTTLPNLAADMTIGGINEGYLNAYLDEIRISKSARFTSNFTPLNRAYNELITASPSYDISDSSASAHTTTANGNARLSGTNLSFGNASLYLDGIDSFISIPDSNDWNLTEGGAPSVDANTKFLLTGDGANASTSFTDLSAQALTVTANGNAQVSTTQSKFGGASIYFDGTGDFLSVPDHANFTLGSGDFSFDCWVYVTSLASVRNIFNQKDATDSFGYQFQIQTNGSIRFISYTAAAVGVADFQTAAGVITTNTWIHIELTRSSTNQYIFKDGVSQSLTVGIGVGTNTMAKATGRTFNIGKSPTTGDFLGYIDDPRLSNVARHTSNFSVPTSSPGEIILPDYTIDLWLDVLEYPTNNAFVIGQSDSWKLEFDGTSNRYLKFSIVGGNTVIATTTILVNNWYHIAIVQSAGTIKLYINGTLGSSITGSLMVNGTNSLRIGATASGTNLLTGYVEEVRISKGIARWTSNFTTPIVEHGTDANTKLLLHLNVIPVENMVIRSYDLVASNVPTSARIVIFEEDIEELDPNVDLTAAISRDGGATWTNVKLAKESEFDDGQLNIYTGSIDLTTQPSGTLMRYIIKTFNNKDCRLRGVALNWR